MQPFMKPRTVREDIYAAIGNTEEDEMPMEGDPAEMKSGSPGYQDPDWRRKASGYDNTVPGKPYETGDRGLDAYHRRRNTEGPPADDPFPDAYKDPKETKRILDGAYNAGATGDTSIEEIIYGPYGNTPFGRLMKRAYEDGKASRRKRR